MLSSHVTTVDASCEIKFTLNVHTSCTGCPCVIFLIPFDLPSCAACGLRRGA